MVEVAEERCYKGGTVYGDQKWEKALQVSLGEVWLTLPTPVAFPATQSNKYLLSTTLPICPGPPSAKTLKSVQAAG